jgi:SAM-dependent methyltransferase
MNKELFQVLDQMRNRPQLFNILDVMQEAKKRNIAFNYDDLRELISRDSRSGLFVPPAFLVEFVTSYFRDAGVKSVLDCWCGSGVFLSAMAKQYKPSKIIGINRSNTENELAQFLESEYPIEWQLGDPLSALDNMSGRFESIVCAPPFGMRSEKHLFNFGEEKIELVDDYSTLLLLKASLLLQDMGTALFILPQRFLFDRNEKRVIQNLNRFGLWIDAIFQLPSGTFYPVTQISGVMVVARKQPRDKVFVGEISSDVNQHKVLLANHRSRKAGKSPQLGALVELESFRSFASLVHEYEVNEISRTMSMSPVAISEICTEINLPKRVAGEEFQEISNSVYLPSIGTSPAITSRKDFRVKPQNYIQLILDQNKAIATYVAAFFNTPLGRKIRDSISSGMIISKISKSALLATTIFLPETSVQAEVIGTQSVITDMESTLDILSRNLWNRPRKYKEIQKSIKAIQPKDDFEKWVDTLPFPVGSILWSYQADVDVEHKIDNLFFFFEALTEFVAVILLSAYASNKDFYAQHSQEWIQTDPKHSDWILESSFGGWRILGERLAKVTRSLKSTEDKEAREVLYSLFGNPSPDFLDMVTNRGLFAILSKVNIYRNQWKGHSGVLSQQEHQQHLSVLEYELSETRKILQDVWQETILLSPGASEYNDGVFEYKVKVLMGANSRFREILVKTLLPMDKNKIYILHAQQQKPVEILPFIRLMPSPRTQANAIYFYNRMAGKDVRWVSYHFEQESEIVAPDNTMTSAIALLRPPIKP